MMGVYGFCEEHGCELIPDPREARAMPICPDCEDRKWMRLNILFSPEYKQEPEKP